MKQAIISCLLIGSLATALQYGDWQAAVLISITLLFVVYGRKLTTATGYMAVRGHSHGGAYDEVCDHEGGHAAGFDKLGGRLTSARVTGNANRANGYTDGYIPNDPASQIGIYLAGFAAAPGTSSDTDHHSVNEVLSKVPSPYRGTILREGQRLANKAGRSSAAASYSRKLKRSGRL